MPPRRKIAGSSSSNNPGKSPDPTSRKANQSLGNSDPAKSAPAVRRTGKIPGYRRQRRKERKDLAFVELGGARIYLGEWGTADSQEAYHRMVAEWFANDRQPARTTPDLTVFELAARYWTFAGDYYQAANGKRSSEVANIRRVLKTLKKLYGGTLVGAFGPKALKAVRQEFITEGCSRGVANKYTSLVKRMFKWGAGEELVDASVFHGLMAVEGLRRGRCKARETEPVRPVPSTSISAIEIHVSRPVWAMIQLQLLTAARPGEIICMRGTDIDTSGKIWLYTPESHKNAYRGHERAIYLGPRAQMVVMPFLRNRELSAYLFSPEEAETERRISNHLNRRTPLHYGNCPGSNRKKNPLWKPGDRYTVRTYGRAIERGCKKAKVPHWHPHQIRHNAATELRKEFGVDVARIILGHRSPAVTEIYAELDHGKAVRAMEEFGWGLGTPPALRRLLSSSINQAECLSEEAGVHQRHRARGVNSLARLDSVVRPRQWPDLWASCRR